MYANFNEMGLGLGLVLSKGRHSPWGRGLGINRTKCEIGGRELSQCDVTPPKNVIVTNYFRAANFITTKERIICLFVSTKKKVFSRIMKFIRLWRDQ